MGLSSSTSDDAVIGESLLFANDVRHDGHFHLLCGPYYDWTISADFLSEHLFISSASAETDEDVCSCLLLQTSFSKHCTFPDSRDRMYVIKAGPSELHNLYDLSASFIPLRFGSHSISLHAAVRPTGFG